MYQRANSRDCHTPAFQQQVVALAQERYQDVKHTHLTELLADRDGLVLSRPTVRRILVRAGLSIPRQRRPPQHRCRRPRMPQEGMLLELAILPGVGISKGYRVVQDKWGRPKDSFG